MIVGVNGDNMGIGLLYMWLVVSNIFLSLIINEMIEAVSSWLSQPDPKYS